MPGVTVTVDEEICVGCGSCIDVCFVKAINLIDEKAVISESCRGCGRCVTTCPQKAITLIIDSKENVYESVKNIESLVDVT